MEYKLEKLQQPVAGSEAGIVRDSVNGDKLVLAVGQDAIVIAIRDVFTYVLQKEQAKKAVEAVNDTGSTETSTQPA